MPGTPAAYHPNPGNFIPYYTTIPLSNALPFSPSSPHPLFEPWLLHGNRSTSNNTLMEYITACLVAKESPSNNQYCTLQSYTGERSHPSHYCVWRRPTGIPLRTPWKAREQPRSPPQGFTDPRAAVQCKLTKCFLSPFIVLSFDLLSPWRNPRAAVNKMKPCPGFGGKQSFKPERLDNAGLIKCFVAPKTAGGHPWEPPPSAAEPLWFFWLCGKLMTLRCPFSWPFCWKLLYH